MPLCDDSPQITEGEFSMATFVLVHGAWHGASAWDRVVPLLEAAGHRAIAFDLPGQGEDETPLELVTLDSYAERTCQQTSAQSEPVILVGHSLGGGKRMSGAVMVDRKVHRPRR
jgi:pimeloyl-ACP methyl ester carboxylesterase